MNPTSAATATRRLASFLFGCCAWLASGAAFGQVTVDTRPAEPRVGDYVFLNVAITFPREDFWITEARLWDLQPKPGAPGEFIADVDIYYHWVPHYGGGFNPSVHTRTVGLGQFDTPGNVEVRLRPLPDGFLPAYYDPSAPAIAHIVIRSGTPACDYEIVLTPNVSGCTPTLRFGTYRHGERSEEIPLAIRNRSGAPIYFGVPDVNNADYGYTSRCGEALEDGESCELGITFSPSLDGSSPGRITIKYSNDPERVPFRVAHALMSGDSRAPAVTEPRSGLRVVEYYAQSVDQYFLTANENEMRALDDGSLGWRRTGVTFVASGPNAVCRFYGDLVAGPRGHFYTARVDACDAMRSQDTNTPRGRLVYRFEGFAFNMGLPLQPFSDGRWRCPENARAIYQLKRPALGGKDQAYRLVPAGRVDGGANGDDIVRNLLAAGWAYEGHAMCSELPPLPAS